MYSSVLPKNSDSSSVIFCGLICGYTSLISERTFSFEVSYERQSLNSIPIYIMYIIYTTLIFLNAHLAFSQQEWIDPHDMNINVKRLKPRDTIHSDTEQYACPSVPINFSMSHYKRLINLILSAVADDQNDLFRGHLYINLPHESYGFLKAFAGDTKDVEDSALLRKVDQILSKALVRPSLERLVEALTSWADRIYFTVYNRTTMIYLSCLFVLFISYKLLRANLTIWSVVKYLLFLGWVTDFAFTWINLLQEAEINKMADSVMYETMPLHCNPNKMTLWQYLTYSMSSTNDCRQYHQTIYKDHFWSIAPVTVLSHQFGTLVYTPASLIGQAVGSFTAGLLGSLPWGINVILLPILLVFSATIMCIAISFLSQTSFRINLIHLLQLEFGNEQRRMVGDALSGRNLNALLNIAHRNMVEDVRHTDNSRPETSVSSNTNENKRTLMVEGQAPTSGLRTRTNDTGNNDNVRLEAKATSNSRTGENDNSIDETDASISYSRNQENVITQTFNTHITLNDGNEDSETCDKNMLESKELCSTGLYEKAPKIETMHDGSGDKF